MHLARWSQSRPIRIFPARLRLAASCGALLALAPLAAHAATAEDAPALNQTLIATLQLRAHAAPPRERLMLFADLADKITLLATRQIADGEESEAKTTLKQLEACTADLQDTVQNNSKGLKKTEMMLHTTNRRLKDLMRGASGEMKPAVQTALKRMDQVQTALLSAVFSR